MYNFCINDFEGPLDLLLHLVKESKMDIYEIETSIIIDQYLDYIHKQEEKNIDIASEYLVMAAELVHLKSRMLINKEAEVEETDEFTITSEEDLKRKLIEYQKYKNITENFKELEEKRSEVFTKLPESLQEYFEEPVLVNSDLTITDLLNAFLAFKEREKNAKPLNTTVTKKELSVDVRIRDIRKIIGEKKRIQFFDLFEETTREYVIVTFLSILEMSKNNEIMITQENNFSDIIIEKRV